MIKISTLAFVVVLVAVLLLIGCAAPCVYQGKAVPAQDAERMKNAGMDVVCP